MNIYNKKFIVDDIKSTLKEWSVTILLSIIFVGIISFFSVFLFTHYPKYRDEILSSFISLLFVGTFQLYSIIKNNMKKMGFIINESVKKL